MVLSFSTEALQDLCSKNQLELLDAIDHLRLQGIDHYISLPQIIVCGDQSSGKSSVLEAISGVPFPVKSNLCTRFPTELVLRRSDHTGVVVSIVPHSDHGKPEKNRLSDFQQNLDGFEGLPRLIESARTFMGITTGGKGFSKDLLRVEINGPDRPHLTIVDLPGLIHSETKQQTASEVELVQEVVKSYMLKRRSIILAVVSAKNDFANQIVLKLARSADPGGERTLGVITKPDTLVVGSRSENIYLSLANNMEVEFSLGWHVLKNLDSETQQGALLLHERNKEESAFLREGVWRSLPASMLGIAALRSRLAELLPRQIAFELPSLIKEINVQLLSSREGLKGLGQPRSTPSEQRLLMMRISQDFQRIVKSAVDGTYNDPFFESARTAKGVEQRIRAVVQDLNKDFADTLRRYGHSRQVVDTDVVAEDPNVNVERWGSSIQNPQMITRASFIDHVRILMERSHGTELPGRFNPIIVADLFVEQSRPWERIARIHVRNVWNSAMRFLDIVISHVCGRTITDGLISKSIKPSMDAHLKELEGKLSQILSPYQSIHPITYNDEYAAATIKNWADEERRTACSKVVRELLGDPISTEYHLNSYINLSLLVNRLVGCTKPSIEKEAASEALGSLSAYYKVKSLLKEKRSQLRIC